MLRWIILCCAVFAVADARAADQLVAKPGTLRAQRQLPPGLPRPYYKAHTTVVYGPPPIPPPVVVVAPNPDVLISFPSTPLLPGSSTLPGYYGRAFDYDYQGPYYGGGGYGYVPYFVREPYACGVTGYC
jgi:hypothetical protein